MSSRSQFVIIDCSQIDGQYTKDLASQDNFQKFAQNLGDGFSSGGFVYFVNHGVPSKTFEEVLQQSKEFFELDSDIKIKYKKVDPVKNFHGYTPPTSEEIANESNQASRDFKESFSFVGREICGTNYPSETPHLRQSVLNFHHAMSSFSKKVLLALGLYLKLDDPEFFLKHHKSLDGLLNPNIDPWIDIRTNYYLALDDEEIASLPDYALRLTEHSDWGTLTFLLQDNVGGLEGKITDKCGENRWVSVPPIAGSILLNSGLMLEMWSGGRFHATAHRVRLIKERAKEVRQSLAWFLAPDGDTRVKILLDKKQGYTWSHTYPPPANEPVTEYFQERIKGIYAMRYKY